MSYMRLIMPIHTSPPWFHHTVLYNFITSSSHYVPHDFITLLFHTISSHHPMQSHMQFSHNFITPCHLESWHHPTQSHHTIPWNLMQFSLHHHPHHYLLFHMSSSRTWSQIDVLASLRSTTQPTPNRHHSKSMEPISWTQKSIFGLLKGCVCVSIAWGSSHKLLGAIAQVFFLAGKIRPGPEN